MAACALGAYLSFYRPENKEENQYIIGRGKALGKPSKIFVTTQTEAGNITGTRVGCFCNNHFIRTPKDWETVEARK